MVRSYCQNLYICNLHPLGLHFHAQDDEVTLLEEEELAKADTYDPMDEVENADLLLLY